MQVRLLATWLELPVMMTDGQFCAEMMANFSEKFAPLGVTCGELTGDVDDMRAATRNTIVCATPEKARCLFSLAQLPE